MKSNINKASDWLKNRYLPDGSVDGYKLAADALPVVRVGAGQYFKNHLKKTPPHERMSNGPAVAFLAIAATDMADGWLARRSITGPDWFGGKLDQYTDKALVLPIIHQLAKNGEINDWHWRIAVGRDIGVSAVREVASHYNVNGYARDLGKYKFWAQTAACASALLPEDVCSQEFTEQLFTVASTLTVASGVDQVQALAFEAFELVKSNETLTEMLNEHGFELGE